MNLALVVVGALVAGGSLLVASTTQAQLRWRAPEECSRDTFVVALERATDHPLNELPTVGVDVHVEAVAADQWLARFHVIDAMGQASAERELRGTSCLDVTNAAAVAVAMALYDEKEPASSKDAVSPADPADNSSPPSKKPEPPPSEALAPKASEISNSSPSGGLHAHVLVDTSLFGEAAVAAGAGVSFYPTTFGFELDGAAFLPKELRTDETLGAELMGVLAGATGCFRVQDAATEPRACLGYQGAYIEAEGTGSGLEVSRRQSALWHAVHVRGSLGTALSEYFALRLFIGASFALNRVRFVFDQARIAHELPAWSAQAGLSFAWQL